MARVTKVIQYCCRYTALSLHLKHACTVCRQGLLLKGLKLSFFLRLTVSLLFFSFSFQVLIFFVQIYPHLKRHLTWAPFAKYELKYGNVQNHDLHVGSLWGWIRAAVTILIWLIHPCCCIPDSLHISYEHFLDFCYFISGWIACLSLVSLSLQCWGKS